MAILPLAVGIADRIIAAARDEMRLDASAVADELIRQFPTANVTSDDVIRTLREEGRSAGLCLDAC